MVSFVACVRRVRRCSARGIACPALARARFPGTPLRRYAIEATAGRGPGQSLKRGSPPRRSAVMSSDPRGASPRNLGTLPSVSWLDKEDPPGVIVFAAHPPTKRRAGHPLTEHERNPYVDPRKGVSGPSRLVSGLPAYRGERHTVCDRPNAARQAYSRMASTPHNHPTPGV